MNRQGRSRGSIPGDTRNPPGTAARADSPPRPRVESRDSGSGSRRRRLLLLTHHFPPSDAVGALRWDRFVRLLAAEGWSFDIVAGPAKCDGGVAAALPPGTRVRRIELPDSVVVRFENTLFRLYGSIRDIRHRLKRRRAGVFGPATGSLMVRAEGVPRSDIRWNLLRAKGWARLWFTFREAVVARRGSRLVARAACEFADPALHAAVVTSGPPHFWHEAGIRVSRAAGIPLVLDLRDPWSVTDLVHDYYATPAWLRLVRTAERRAVEHADLVVLTTDTLRESMADHYAGTRARFLTVTNGFDDLPMPVVERGAAFTIGYAGTIYFGRDPRPLFHGVARVVRELSLSPADLSIRFIGDARRYGGVDLTTLAREAGLEGFVSVGGRVSAEEARRFMASCHMLVSLPWEDGLTIPAKLFEYIRFPAWLLVFAKKDSAIERLLHGQEADLVENADIAGVAAAVRRRLEQHRRGEVPVPVGKAPHLSRAAQAALLSAALEAIGRSAPSGVMTPAPVGRTRARTLLPRAR